MEGSLTVIAIALLGMFLVASFSVIAANSKISVLELKLRNREDELNRSEEYRKRLGAQNDTLRATVADRDTMIAHLNRRLLDEMPVVAGAPAPAAASAPDSDQEPVERPPSLLTLSPLSLFGERGLLVHVPMRKVGESYTGEGLPCATGRIVHFEWLVDGKVLKGMVGSGAHDLKIRFRNLREGERMILARVKPPVEAPVVPAKRSPRRFLRFGAD